MRSEPINSFIYFGLYWRYLQDAQTGYTIHGKNRILANIERVTEELKRFELQVTLRAAYQLEDLYLELKELPADATLSEQQAKNLRDLMNNLQTTLNAEAMGFYTYVVTDKRLDIRKLIGNPQSLFAPGVFDSLPLIAKYDFAEAGVCIAFERTTAAGFHLLRGTEAELRNFYCVLVKRDRVSPLLWFDMTDHLAKRKKKPPVEILKNLDNIRLSYRNPTQHPEKIYDIQEVQDLFGLCIDIVNRMVQYSELINKS